jgi:hypothetical protein
MFSQFQAQYPTGSLVAELVQIHEGYYIVKATVQVGGVTLATGMSAATTLEQAEDRARLRALAVVGIEPASEEDQGSRAHLMTQVLPNRLQPAQPSLEDGFAETEFTGWALSAAASDRPAELDAVPPQPPKVRTDSKATPPELAFEFAEPPPVESGQDLSQPTVQNGRSAASAESGPKPLASKSSSQLSSPESEAMPGPLDLSDIIAQTSVELKRLGWTNAQGRTHLQQTYGKRSRQQLSDAELLDFLNYLQSEAVQTEPSF